MTTPCRSDCPAGDCAGCAFPPAACRPSQACPQASRCARHAMPREGDSVIDATVLRVGKFCPLFLDVRLAALREAA